MVTLNNNQAQRLIGLLMDAGYSISQHQNFIEEATKGDQDQSDKLKLKLVAFSLVGIQPKSDCVAIEVLKKPQTKEHTVSFQPGLPKDLKEEFKQEIRHRLENSVAEYWILSNEWCLKPLIKTLVDSGIVLIPEFEIEFWKKVASDFNSEFEPDFMLVVE